MPGQDILWLEALSSLSSTVQPQGFTPTSRRSFTQADIFQPAQGKVRKGRVLTQHTGLHSCCRVGSLCPHRTFGCRGAYTLDLEVDPAPPRVRAAREVRKSESWGGGFQVVVASLRRRYSATLEQGEGEDAAKSCQQNIGDASALSQQKAGFKLTPHNGRVLARALCELCFCPLLQSHLQPITTTLHKDSSGLIFQLVARA